MRIFPGLSVALAVAMTWISISSRDALAFDDDYDRLDGHGRSGKRVNVIEWQGNLEIHVYPGGSTRSLALKIDDRNPAKKVMVIGYRFDSNPGEQLVRRNILSTPIEPGFKVYRDPRSGKEYDKFVVTNSRVGAPLIAYEPEPGPQRLYPEETPAIAEKKPEVETRQPASRKSETERDSFDEETGTIRSRSW